MCRFFRSESIPSGSKKQGFKSQVQKGITVEILQVRRVDLTLELGAVSETVTVDSHAPLLETETSQAGEVIRTEQVNRLPLNVRQFMQLAFLTPMAVPATSDFRSNEVNRDTPVPKITGTRAPRIMQFVLKYSF